MLSSLCVAAQRSPVLLASCVCLAASLAACGDSPTEPTPVPLTIVCPANLEVTSRDGVATTVTFSAPTTSGGAPPVATTCSPASGASFPLGTSTVSCTARDRAAQAASCSFSVRVAAPPYVRFTKYVAFGDSITEGQDGTVATALTDVSAPRVIVPSEHAYPGRLRQLLADRYIAQIFPPSDHTYMNQGRGGETTTGGLARLPGVLSSLQPEVLLLLEGANDIATGAHAGVEQAEDGLRGMVRSARSHGVRWVLLATLTPQRSGGPKSGGAELVVPLNNEIKIIAVDEGALLVDVHAAFGGDLSLISPDGLHPTEAGFQRMAETFYTVIRNNFEIPFPGASTPTAFTSGGGNVASQAGDPADHRAIEPRHRVAEPNPGRGVAEPGRRRQPAVSDRPRRDRPD
jgi:lysophospholipase L1-like esterase